MLFFFILCLFLVIISEIGIIVCDYIIIDISFILCVVVFFCMWVIYRIFFYHWYNGLFFILCLFLVIRIGIILCDYIIIDISFILCVIFRIYDNIKDIHFHILFLWWFLFFMCCMWSLALCDNGFIYYHWLMIIFFHFLCVCFGLWVYNPCDMGNYLYHRTGIYLFDFFFVCVFWGS